MAEYVHTMLRITDPEKSRAFYEALGFTFSRDMDIVRDGQLEATNYFFSICLGARTGLARRAERAQRASEPSLRGSGVSSRSALRVPESRRVQRCVPPP